MTKPSLWISIVALAFVPNFAYAVNADSDFCKRIAEYKLQAGVEHKGDHSVPADINPLSGSVDDLYIPITVDLVQKYGLVLSNGIELKPDVAALLIKENGDVYYNGRKLKQSAEELCVKKSDEVDGQGSGNELPSEPVRFEVKEGIEGEILTGQYPE